MKCLILAGGFGVRLYPLTQNKAKALLEFEGKPLVNYLIEMVPRSMEIMVSTNRKFEVDFLKWQEEVGRDVELWVEETLREEEKRGAVGALDFWVSQKDIKEDLLVIAGDNYFGFDLARFIEAYNGNTLVAIHDIGDRDKAREFGVVQVDGSRLVGLEEKPQNPKSSLIATACYVFPPRVFPILHQYCVRSRRDNLGSFLAHLIDIDEVYGYLFSERWFDIGSKPK